MLLKVSIQPKRYLIAASLLNIDMPITNEVNNVLFHEKSAKEAVLDLIQRPITQE